MIANSTQTWTAGSTVKVGFLTLQVAAAVATPGNYAPDAYVLTRGPKFYAFVPHNGLHKLDATSLEAATIEAKRV